MSRPQVAMTVFSRPGQANPGIEDRLVAAGSGPEPGNSMRGGGSDGARRRSDRKTPEPGPESERAISCCLGRRGKILPKTAPRSTIKRSCANHRAVWSVSRRKFPRRWIGSFFAGKVVFWHLERSEGSPSAYYGFSMASCETWTEHLVRRIRQILVQEAYLQKTQSIQSAGYRFVIGHQLESTIIPSCSNV